jgi:hypothetical protein
MLGMRWWCVVVMLAGCDRIFGIHDTHELHIDAQFFDAGIDAPFACPAVGAPVYSPLLHQEFVQNCGEYNISADGTTAVGLCYVGAQASLHIGPPGMPLEPAGIPQSGQGAFAAPRLTPDGNELIVLEYSFNDASVAARHFVRAGSSWQTAGPLPFTLDAYRSISHIARTPTGDRLFVLDSMARNAQEWELSNGTWTQHGPPITADELGVPSFFRIALTPDGLHMLISAGGSADQPLFFTQRVTADSPLATAAPAQGVPHVDTPYMTNDCARVYFAGLGSIFYAQQQ